ncbi:BRO-N domain-containing protein [Lactobacillus amylolyticus]|uniref:BRO-N domain-containing protein n=1 Tax=Lactobacillus amylolyticus TaxID=83683 RepID=UPI00249274B8|nr:BRO family protein [Lactobacillus amylolyticus]
MKTELWNGYPIRFVEIKNEWLAVAKDVSDALDYANTSNMVKHVPSKFFKHSILEGMSSKSLLLTEFGIYKAIFGSHKKEAEQFQEWVFNVIKTLRTQSGLEGFEIFRTLDKEHQRKMMNQLSQSLSHPVRLNFMKANIIADKAVSNKFGFKKMIKKGEMTPQMLAEREHILEDVVNLMALQDKYGLNISISETIYGSANDKQLQPV